MHHWQIFSPHGTETSGLCLVRCCFVWKYHNKSSFSGTSEWIYCPTVKHRGRRHWKLRMFNLLHVVKVNLPVKDGSLSKTKRLLSFLSLPEHWHLSLATGIYLQWLNFVTNPYSNIYLVCLLPLRSCCATEAHLSASCVTSLRCRSRSLSGNFFISDSSIKALKLMRPFGKDIKLTKVSFVMDLKW